MDRILITGGAGAIGSCLVEALCNHKEVEAIYILDNLSSGNVNNITTHKLVNFVYGSILNDEILDYIFRQEINVVFHMAANFANQNSVDFPETDLQTNGMGTLKLLRHATKYAVKKFIYSSSSCIYGNKESVLQEDDFGLCLDTPYAITKLLGENYVTFYSMHFALPTVILRFFNTYGPGEMPGKYRNVIPNFIYKAMNKEKLVITGDGNESRYFNYIDDTVNGIMLAYKNNSSIGETFNIASENETRILELAEIINEIVGNSSGIDFIQRRSWDSVTNRKASIEKSKYILKYVPEVSLQKGLEKTYQWLKKQDFRLCNF